jgi:hypothetical protein
MTVGLCSLVRLKAGVMARIMTMMVLRKKAIRSVPATGRSSETLSGRGPRRRRTRLHLLSIVLAG